MFLFISGKYFLFLRIVSFLLREIFFVIDLFFFNYIFFEYLFGLWSNL